MNVSLPKLVKAAASAFKAMRFTVTKTTVKDDVAQIIGEHQDKRVIWVDIHKITESTSRIEVRVGVKGDKEASRMILAKIKKYL